jgi:NADH:ubiquinone oxidoreductase subunit D
MKRQNNQCWFSSLSVAIATIIFLSTFGPTFAQTEKERPKGSLAAYIIGAGKNRTTRTRSRSP